MLHIDILKTYTNSAKDLLVSLEAYRESAQEAVSRFRDWLSAQDGDNLLTVLISDLKKQGEAVIACVPYSAYDEALSGTSDQVTVVSNTGESLVIEARRLIDAIEGQITDIRLQSNFLDYITGAEELNRDTFINQAHALLANVSSNILEVYGSFISGASDAIEAFKAFLSYGTAGAKVEDTYISVVDSSQYGGNVLASVFTQIGKGIVNMFQSTADKVVSFLAFGFRALEMTWNLVKWLGKKLFAEQLSAFEILNSHRSGLLHLPFGQWRFSGDEDRIWSALFRAFPNAPVGSIHYKELSGGKVFYDHLASFGDTNSDARSNAKLLLSKMRIGLREPDGNGGTVTTIRDIPLPSTYPSDRVQFVLRIGRTPTDHDLVLQIFPVVGRGFINRTTTDHELSKIMAIAYGGVIEALGEVLPFTPVNSSLAYTHDDFIQQVFLPEINKHIYMDKMNADSSATFLTKGLGYYLPERNVTVTYDWVQNNPSSAMFLASLLVFAAAYGFSSTKAVTTSAWALLSQVDIDGPNGLTIDQAKAAARSFRAFSKLPTPVAVHYQTTEEYASDWVKLLRIAAITAVAVVVAIASIKAYKKWKTKIYLAEAAMDSASWDVASAVGTDGYAAAYATFSKARTKFIRLHLVEVVAGLIPTGLSSLTSGLSAVSDRLTSDQTNRMVGEDPAFPSESTVSLNSIYHKITG